MSDDVTSLTRIVFVDGVCVGASDCNVERREITWEHGMCEQSSE